MAGQHSTGFAGCWITRLFLIAPQAPSSAPDILASLGALKIL
jgi:hypothetical protein